MSNEILDKMHLDLQNMNNKIDDLSAKIDENSKITNKILAQVLKTNGRVTKHDQEIEKMAHKIDKIEDNKSQKFSDLKSKKTKLRELLNKVFNKFKK